VKSICAGLKKQELHAASLYATIQYFAAAALHLLRQVMTGDAFGMLADAFEHVRHFGV